MRILLPLCLIITQLVCAQLLESTLVHSHNDYLQEVPFSTAYDAKANSIEVDIFLRNDSLFVAHHESEIIPQRTIEKLYLKPLEKAFSRDIQNNIKIQLLIDIKSEARATLKELIALLNRYPDLNGNKNISFVISGNRPPPEEYLNYPDFILFDYQSLEDLKDPEIWKKVALISLPFHKYSRWNGKEEIPDVDLANIEVKIDQAQYQYGKPFRFWATPDTELAWKTFAQLGIDFINTDKPVECAAYIEKLKRVHH